MSDLSAAVGRAAEAHYESTYPDDKWADATDIQHMYLRDMEVAIEAALPVIEQMHRAAHAEEFAAVLLTHRLDADKRPKKYADEDKAYNIGIEHCVEWLVNQRWRAAAKETTDG